MLRIGLDIRLHCCPCACLGPCGDTEEPPPTPFAEFYSDVGVKKTLALPTDVALPGTFSTDVFELEGLYPIGTVIDYELWVFAGGVYSATGLTASFTTVDVEDQAVELIITGLPADPPDQYVIFKRVNGGYWEFKVHDYAFPWSDYGDAWGYMGSLSPADYCAPKAGDEAAATTSGDLISKLEDQSGNGRHLVQATAASRPTVNAAAALNGRAPLSFAATLQALLTSALPAVGDFTIFLVAQLTSGLPYRDFLFLTGPAAGVSFYRDASDNLRLESGGGTIGTSADTSGNRVLVLTRTGGAATIHRELVQRSSGTIGADTFTAINLGHALGTGAFNFYALVVHDRAFNATERSAEVARLQTRYAL